MKKIRHINGFDMKNTFRNVAVSVWFQGCEHRCKGCFNPETWKITEEEMTTEEFMEFRRKLKEDGIEKDVSYLGGDPFLPTNREDFETLLLYVKNVHPNSKQFAWTGYDFETLYNLQLPHLNYLDVIVDGKFEQSLKIEDKKYGSSNQRVWVKEDGFWTISDKY